MQKWKLVVLLCYFFIVFFNLNTVIGFLLNREAILSDFLIVTGLFSLFITIPFVSYILRNDLIILLAIFIFVFTVCSGLSAYLQQDDFLEAWKHCVYQFNRSIIVVIPTAVLFWIICKKKGLHFLLVNYVIVSVLASLSVPLFKFLGISFEDIGLNITDYNRYSGIWGNANVAASFINSSLIVCLSLSLTGTVKARYIYLTICIFTYCILLTSSNTGAIIFLNIVVLYWYYSLVSGKVYSVRKFGFITLVITLYLCSIWLMGHRVATGSGYIASKSENIFRILSLDFGHVALSQRDILTEEGWALIKENWILGYGSGYFSMLPIFGKGSVMHNYYIVMWGEAGIIGILNVLVFLSYIIYKTFGTKDNTLKFLYSATFLYLTITFFSGGGIIGVFNPLIYYVMVATIAVRQVREKHWTQISIARLYFKRSSLLRNMK